MRFLILFCLLLPAAAAPIAFQNARVFDGTKLLTNTTVLVRDGKIAAVGKDIPIPADAQVVDVTGKTLLPGLFDAHTHVWGANSLRQALAFGVTTECDMFTGLESLKEIHDEIAAGKGADLADLRSAGILATAPGGHGTEYGQEIPTISSPAEAQAFVDARLAEGSDYIKIVYEHGRAFGRPMPTIDVPTLKALVEAAHARKKMAVVHIGSQSEARETIEAGADALVHIFIEEPPAADFAKLAADHHTFIVPTLTVLHNVAAPKHEPALLKDPDLSPYYSAVEIDRLGASFPQGKRKPADYSNAEAAVRQLKAARVPICAGTDCPNPGTTHGASIHEELELLVAAGLTPAEALTAATSVPATCFHLEDRGRIAPGLRADLLLVEGDPTADLKATRKIAGVWKEGVALDRVAYQKRAEKQRVAAKQGTPPPDFGTGLVSDFEEGRIRSKFGAGWQTSTDSLRGGKSTAEFKVVEGGAENSKYSLRVEGEVIGGSDAAWAGAMFFPGPVQMQPANLSSKKSVSFWARGDGRAYSVMLFCPSKNWAPLMKTFVAGPEWKPFTFTFADFETDAHDVAGIFIGAGNPTGKFTFQLDSVKID